MSHTTIHEIVSNADTIIYLENPCESFAAWDGPAPQSPAPSPVADPSLAEIEEADYQRPKTVYLSKKDRKKKVKRSTTVVQADEPPPSPPPPESPPQPLTPISPSPPPLDTVDAIEDQAEPVVPEQGPSVEPEVSLPEESIHDKEPADVVDQALEAVEAPSDPLTPCVEVRRIEFRVCAGNLMSASPWFNRTLKKGGWMESTWNPEERCFQLDASDWDEEAFVIMMNVFHLRNRLVPRAISLEMLAKIAVLADYYECDESLQLWVEIWIPHLTKTSPVPKKYCRDLILWLWISWALKLPELFSRATTVAVEQATEPVRNLGLPIPAWIIDGIDLQRCRAIEKIVIGLEAQLFEYSDEEYSCPSGRSYSFRCGCMLLGALTKKMEMLSLRSSHLQSPFLGTSVRTVCETARTIDSEVWYHTVSGYSHSYGSSYNQHPCKLSTVVGPLVDSAVAGVKGLGLKRTTSN